MSNENTEKVKPVLKTNDGGPGMYIVVNRMLETDNGLQALTPVIVALESLSEEEGQKAITQVIQQLQVIEQPNKG